MFDIKEKLKKYDVVLASQSPRRKELLSLICDDFRVVPAKGEEIYSSDIPTENIPVLLALNKCKEIAENNPDSLVIGCDTVVVLKDKIMGKPENKSDAFEMLSSLSGKTHRVISGTAFYVNKNYYTLCSVTEVCFRKLTDEDINAYIATGEPFDKAGAYGIQGLGCLLVKEIKGDYFNVVGLPLSDLAEKLNEVIS
ncbi:MAG: Maf family protein [Oscillospiraceae bacterium]